MWEVLCVVSGGLLSGGLVSGGLVSGGLVSSEVSSKLSLTMIAGNVSYGFYKIKYIYYTNYTCVG